MNSQEQTKCLGALPTFDPADGTTIIEPLGEGSGYWCGAPNILRDTERGLFYLYYRVRQPRPIRGGECRIAVSNDGVHFEDIWTLKKEALNSPSIERGSLIRMPDGKFRMYLSYVDPSNNKWRIDLLEADDPAHFDIADRRPIMTADEIGAAGVKDPVVLRVGNAYYMIASYAPLSNTGGTSDAAMHGTADVFNTGIIKSATGLAVSQDGLSFQWVGEVLSPSESGWDSFCARVVSVVYRAPVFHVFYDGSDDVEDNYEERTGYAISFDLERFRRISVDGPILTSPYGKGSLRYIDTVEVDNELYYYYEYTRKDGSHELRLNRVSLAG